MATRRNINTEEATKEPVSAVVADTTTDNAVSKAALNVPRSVIAKLLLFTFAMIVGPLATYYISVTSLFVGNNTVAGALAAVSANAVLVGYIVVAMVEDDTEETKKSQ